VTHESETALAGTHPESQMLKPLEAFAREIIRDSWEGCDGGDIIQELAIKHGLIKGEPFDPKIHGTSSECEPGDNWYTFAGPLASPAPVAPVAVGVKSLTYGQKLIAEAIQDHFGERIEDYDEDADDTATNDAWEAFDALVARAAALSIIPAAKPAVVSEIEINDLMEALFGPFDLRTNSQAWVAPNREEFRNKLRAALSGGIETPAATVARETPPLLAAKFRKKPVVIEAIRWTGQNLFDIISFTDGTPDLRGSHAGMRWEDYSDLVSREGLKIFTLEGKMSASPGDWIIRGVAGEFYPCKSDIFKATYEPVSTSGGIETPKPEGAK